jgi:hypothetical protein
MAQEISSKNGSIGEAIASIAAAVLTILGVAHVVPTFLVAIATIAFGAALLLYDGTTLGECAHLAAQGGEGTSAPLSGGGLSAVLLAGIGGVILGILALLGISTLGLTAIAVIAFGSALILGSNSALRLHFFKLAMMTPVERSQPLPGDMLAGELVSSSAGIYGSTGLTAIVLGILALAGFSPVNLILIALLALGSVNVINDIDMTGVLVSTFRRA